MADDEPVPIRPRSAAHAIQKGIPTILIVTFVVAIVLPLLLLAFVQWSERRKGKGVDWPLLRKDDAKEEEEKKKGPSIDEKGGYWAEVARLEEEKKKENEERQMTQTAVKDNVIFDGEGGIRTSDPDALGGKTDRYSWTQSDKEVTVEATVPAGTRGKDIDCVITTTRLKLVVAGDSIFDGELHSRIIADESIWEIVEDGEERKVSLIMTKMDKTRGNKHWDCVVKGHEKIDTKKFGPPVVAIGPGLDNHVDVGKITGRT